jgi:hypothetical protein
MQQNLFREFSHIFDFNRWIRLWPVMTRNDDVELVCFRTFCHRHNPERRTDPAEFLSKKLAGERVRTDYRLLPMSELFNKPVGSLYQFTQEFP